MTSESESADGPNLGEWASQSPEAQIALVIGNERLASAICHSADAALSSRVAYLSGGGTVKAVFEASLNAAIRDIENDPRGKLFRRLILYGPPDPDEPKAISSDGETTLSDPECGLCVDFIYSHMVNRFKGELAELLALKPIIHLAERLQREGRLPAGVRLYWGDMVQERRRAARTAGGTGVVWGHFTKGADGLLVRQEPVSAHYSERSLVVCGIVEVKSMVRSRKRVLDQIERHRMRLLGGVKLGSREWPPDRVLIAGLAHGRKAAKSLIRVMVLPSRWKLSRVLHNLRIDDRTSELRLEEPSEPPVGTRIEQSGPDSWRVTLAWSQEALSEAAYEMTRWYMAQVGGHVYAERPVPWDDMTPWQAGVHMVKHRLYTIGIRYISARQAYRAYRIYNAHSFGFAVAADIWKEELWPSGISMEEHENRDEGHR
jgi:hypothetical protein